MSSTCDESRCVSKGNSLAYNGSFTCYGDGIFYPKMCADGYLPVDVTDEAPIAVPDPIFGQVTLQYFTCCPPSHSALTTTTTTTTTESASESIPNITSSNMEEPVARHCSDPMSGVDQDEICRDMGSQQFARPLNIDFFKKFTPFGSMTVRKEDSFLCCDQDTSDNSAIEFLDEIECLPYANEVYEPAVFFSIVGIIDVVDCDIPGFTVPRPLFGDDADFAGPVYQCCKTGTPLPPFVQDRAFKVTVYTEMVIAAIAVFVSLIAGVALLIPLFQQIKEETNKRRNSSSKGISSSILNASTSSRKAPPSGLSTVTSSISARMMRSFRGSVRASTRGSVRGKSVPKYSTYNIYLVYLVLADFFYFLMYIALFGTNINQKFYPQFFASLLLPSTYGIYSFENKIAYPYVAANLWINAIICYQLLVLLKSSKRAQRIQQPSARLVNIQIWVVYLFVTICGIILDYLWNAMNAAGTEGNLERQQTLLLIANLLLGFMGLPPFVYAIYVSCVIWWGGYIPSIKGATPRAKAMRQLAFYFFRIIAVFLGVWFPVYTCLVLALQLQEYWLLAVGYWLTTSQPILTFLVVLTKSDARMYIWDLVTFSHLIKYCKNRRREDDADVGGGGSSSSSQKGPLKKDLEGGTASGFTESVQTNSVFSKSGVEDISGENRNVSNKNSSGRGESIEEEEEEDLLEDDSEDIIASVLGFSSHFNMRDSRHGAGLGVDTSQKSVSSVDLWAPKE